MLRRTKIICTLGPSTDNPDTIRSMIEAGMNVARLNFSHGTHEEQKKRIEMVRQVRDDMGAPLGILLDTKGPEIRIKTFRDDKIMLEEGQLFTLTTRETEGTNEIVSITYAGLPKDVQVGTRILIDDGLIEMVVEELNDTDIVCRVQNSGPLSNRKSINVPGVSLNMPYVSEQDEKDIEFGCDLKVDFIAASFVRTAADVKELKKILRRKKMLGKTRIIAKIENREGFENLDKIIKEVDGIMVARGDMGVEVPFDELPKIQKKIIRKCMYNGKISITATQMLDSMTHNPRPTRAEVSDVANAVYDGTGAVMLSGETSVGKYPIETVRAMANICVNSEADIDYPKRRSQLLDHAKFVGDAMTIGIAGATVTTSELLDSSAIVALTNSGHSANAVARFRPVKPIIGATYTEETYHRLSLSWGVIPRLCHEQPTDVMLYAEAVRAAILADCCKPGDTLVLTAGLPVGATPFTNTLRIMHITQAEYDAYKSWVEPAK
ncbi:MAG: pyruvate kinase [Butyricicoccus sp.]